MEVDTPTRHVRRGGETVELTNVEYEILLLLVGAAGRVVRRDELAGLGRDFDALAAQVEALMSAQGRLLRDISHELRTPLARLRVALDLLHKRTGPEAEGHLAPGR